MPKFRCLHCAICCENIKTQINLTLGDIKRISEFTGKTVEGLFKENIGIKPFGSIEEENRYDYELGLDIPCTFRKDGKCSIYEARPLNCRLFPFWIIASAPKEELKNIITPEHKCMLSFEPDDSQIASYRHFVDKLSDILFLESEITENFMKRNNMTDSVYFEPGRFTDEEMMKICLSIVDKEKYKGVDILAKEEIRKHVFSDTSKINEIHDLLE